MLDCLSEGLIVSLLLLFGGSAPSTYTASSAVTVGGAETAVSATHTAPIYTGSCAPTVGSTAGAANATHTAPVYTGSASPSTAGVDGAATATHTVPVYTASAAPTSGGTDGAASATHTAPVFAGSAAPVVAATDGSASATHVTPTYTATTSPVAGGTDGAATASHVAPTFAASATGDLSGVTGTAIATFAGVTYAATVAVTVGGAECDATAFSTNVTIASASLTIGGVIGVGRSVGVQPYIGVKAYRRTAGCASKLTTSIAAHRRQSQANKPFVPDTSCIDIADPRAGTADVATAGVRCSVVAITGLPIYQATASMSHGGVICDADATFAAGSKTASAAVAFDGMWVAGAATWIGPYREAAAAMSHSGVTGVATAAATTPAFSGSSGLIVGAVSSAAVSTFASGSFTGSAVVTTVRPRMFASVQRTTPAVNGVTAIDLPGVTAAAVAISNTVFFVGAGAVTHSGTTGAAGATHVAPTYTASVAVQHSGVTGTVAALRTPPVFAASPSLSLGNATFAALATSVPPVTRTANSAVIHSGVTGAAAATFASVLRTGSTGVTIGHVAATSNATFTAPSGGTTPLSQPYWLEWTEDYPYQKPGIAYDSSTYETIFQENNVLVATSSAQFATHLATAQANSSIDAIWLDPVGNPYTYPLNAMRFMAGRSISRPLVIRTVPTASSQASFSGTPQENFYFINVAYIDLNFPSGMSVQDSCENIIYERCTGSKISLNGGRDGTTPPNSDPLRPVKNLHVRLCALTDAYAASGNPAGLFVFNFDGCLIEGNLFDHNGWTGTNRDTGGATSLRHNIYLSRLGFNAFIRYNITSRAASHGGQIKSGARIRRNLSINNPIGWQQGFGGDGFYNDYGVVLNAVTQDNLFLGSADITSNDKRGTAIWTVCIFGHVANGNYAIDNQTDAVNDAFFYVERNYPTDLTATGNVSRDWPNPVLYRNPAPPTPPPYVPTVNETGNNWNISGMQSGAQALVDSFKSDSYLDTLKVSAQRIGIDIVQLQDDMDFIRSGAIIP